MRRLRYLGLAALAAVSVGAVGNQALGAPAPRGQAAPQQTNECNGIRECLRAQGPWVVVPARGEVLYLLDCPRRQGIVGGVDALSSASNVQVQFEAQLGAPVAPGRTTTRYALFRAYTTNGRRGLFQPRIGCIRTSASPRSTTAVKATPGAPAALAATTIRVGPGAVQTSTIGCVPGQKLVRVWTARAFRTERMPQVALADALDVQHEVRGKAANVAIASSEALPRSARAEVQLGVGCSQR